MQDDKNLSLELEIIVKEIENQNNITFIFDDLLLYEKFQSDFNFYGINELFYKNNIDNITIKTLYSDCVVIDYSVLKLNPHIIDEVYQVQKTKNIIILSNEIVDDIVILDLKQIYSFVHNYSNNKTTLFFIIKSLMDKNDNDENFKMSLDKEIRAFKNYSFYMTENDPLNILNIIKGIENYFFNISLSENFLNSFLLKKIKKT